ncbi:MAG: histidine kinase dimerization/phospho-acceptor domain-containing protein [candidate division Zixibacteria bacterium]|nr:histidine kinase dimerization/phospho-acceptor domain-containing protein [candidate division Zixibacteria bacterium]
MRDTRSDLANGSLFAETMKTKRPMVIAGDVQLDYATDRLLDHLGEKRVAMTPLVSRDRAIGLLLVDNAITHEEITEHDTRFLKLIADQTAAAVERSYLYRDIKERAQELEEMNRKLADTQNQIIEAERMSVIGEITSAVAHELRNPLTIIGGFAHLMYKNLEPSSPDGEYLNIIISETQRAEAVVTDVLDFSRASKTPDRQLDLNQLAHNALDMLDARFGRGRCAIRTAMIGAVLPLWGNPDQLLYALYQVFRSMTLDMPCEEVHVGTSVQDGYGRVEIRFADADKNHDKVEKLLKQYFSGGSNSKRLSLIVAEETLKHHGGWLGVESDDQSGPMLSIHLPLYKEAAHAQNFGG